MYLKKNRELFLHWLLTISGGFMGAYSIIALGGNFTNAITGNMINFMRSLSGGNFFEFIIRVGVLFVFASGVMSTIYFPTTPNSICKRPYLSSMRVL